MSIGADGEPRQEIIIVRRGGHDEDEAHHGGVWKIAFADFMTALMCFFLVMWLINAANEQTRVALASYFNPVKLIDRNTSRKGLDDPEISQPLSDAKDGKKNPSAKPAAGSNPDKATAKETKDKQSPSVDTLDEKHPSDQSFFSDPYAVLSEIAGETGVKQNLSAKGDGGTHAAGPATGASGGKAYRDPFAPDFWSEQVHKPQDSGVSALPSPTNAPATPPAAGASKKAAAPVVAKAEPAAPPHLETSSAAKSQPAQPSPRVIAEATAISHELAKDFGHDDKIYRGLSVVPTDKGVAISVTDQMDYGMFEIGSAVPRKELVLAMEKIARTLASHDGEVRINGYTDARPYKGGAYDNWQLSSARAQAAYYMLSRAGLDTKRVLSITGYADRKLKVGNDPYAAANRRIEILLQPGG